MISGRLVGYRVWRGRGERKMARKRVFFAIVCDGGTLQCDGEAKLRRAKNDLLRVKLHIYIYTRWKLCIRTKALPTNYALHSAKVEMYHAPDRSFFSFSVILSRILSITQWYSAWPWYIYLKLASLRIELQSVATYMTMSVWRSGQWQAVRNIKATADWKLSRDTRTECNIWIGSCSLKKTAANTPPRL